MRFAPRARWSATASMNLLGWLGTKVGNENKPDLRLYASALIHVPARTPSRPRPQLAESPLAQNEKGPPDFSGEPNSCFGPGWTNQPNRR